MPRRFAASALLLGAALASAPTSAGPPPTEDSARPTRTVCPSQASRTSVRASCAAASAMSAMAASEATNVARSHLALQAPGTADPPDVTL